MIKFLYFVFHCFSFYLSLIYCLSFNENADTMVTKRFTTLKPIIFVVVICVALNNDAKDGIIKFVVYQKDNDVVVKAGMT